MAHLRQKWDYLLLQQNNRIMSSGPGPLFTNLHQIGQTVAWCLFYDCAVVAINLRQFKNTDIVHSLLGWSMLILTYICILVFLIPNGFNVGLANNSVLLFIHGILGLCMMAFVVLQVIGGVITKLNIDKSLKIQFAEGIKKAHRYFGFFIGLIYKINVIWSWVPSWIIMGLLLLWQIAFISTIVYLKLSKQKKLQHLIVDGQIDGRQLAKVSSSREISALTHSYVIFANYIYEASSLVKAHPGGPKVIQTIMGREVDRFLYGMYSSELLPQLLPHSHSGTCLKLVGKPIAQLDIPSPYQGFHENVVRVKIGSVRLISQKTQIYELGLVSLDRSFVYGGYTKVQQLGQYYSFTIDDQITRLYTTVNFLNHENIALMLKFAPNLKGFQDKYGGNRQNKLRESQLSELKKNNMQVKLLDKDQRPPSKSFLPVMLKVYNNGKLTSALKSRSFDIDNLKISSPRGRGLELAQTTPGRIIVLAGGTGLFPFCDLIDLLYKSQILSQGHQESSQILRQNPVLRQSPFSKFTFVLLIALNQPDDIHPLILHQLIHLSQKSKTVKIVMRISKNSQVISSQKSKIEFTRDYFNKRVLSQASIQGLSRIWICGPPKLNSDTAKDLIQNGYSRQSFLLV